MKKKKNIALLSKALKQNLLRRKSDKQKAITTSVHINNIIKIDENNSTKQ